MVTRGLARLVAAGAAVVALAAMPGAASAQVAIGRVAVLPVVDSSGSVPAAQVSGLTASLRASVPTAIAAEQEADSLRVVADGLARTSVSGSPGARLVTVEIVIYASGEVRRGSAIESEVTQPDADGSRLRMMITIAFRRAAVGLSITVNDAVPQAAPVPVPQGAPWQAPPDVGPQAVPVPVPPPYVPPPPPPYVPVQPVEPSEPEVVVENRRALQFGARALADRFAGALQLGLLQADAQRFLGGIQLSGWVAGAGDFYGLFQLGVKQSVTEGDFVGLGQLGLVMNAAGDARTIVQAALFENSAERSFIGGLQVSPMRNVAGHFVGVGQVGIINRADAFQGLLQLGLWNRLGPDEGSGGSGGEQERFRRFVGLGQLGLYNRAGRDVYALFQLGIVSATSRADFIGGTQLGAFATTSRGSFYGALQLGGAVNAGKDFAGLVQAGVVSVTQRSFRGLAQVGALNYVGDNIVREVFGSGGDESYDEQNFQGLTQAGAVSITDRDFQGVLQFGGLGTYAGRDFYGVAQVGGLAAYVETSFHGVLQLAGFNYVDNDFYGVLQVGAASYADDSFSGLSQIGAVNLSGGEHAGGQIGVVNAVRERLWGFQVGALSYAKNGTGVQLGGGNLSDRFTGFQVGAVNYVGDEMTGLQAGVVNVGDEVSGVQVGLVNRAKKLKGLQLGLVNIASRGGFLPVFPVVNAGF